MDLFALGAIIAELYSGVPLFPGSSEKDQLVRILQVMGTPTKEDWPEGYRLAAQLSFEIPQYEPTSLSKLLPQAPPQAIALIANLLQVPPHKRMTAQQALQHDYFQVKDAERAEEATLQDSPRHNDHWVKNPRYKPGKRCRL
jgi:protein kinase